MEAQGISSDWNFGAYLDVGYLGSDNRPENRTWRSKSTTNKLDRIEANIVRGFVRKDATAASRWGLEFGLQAGVDPDGLVTAPPPPAYAPVSDADLLLHLSTTTVSYLFDAGRGLLVEGGLLLGYIAYESFFARNNPNYTRGYLTDYVPYYSWGLQASYPFTDHFTADFILMTGYNYLASPNDAPSYGLQLNWGPASPLVFVQNLYYGPEQSDTAIDFWRFLSDTIVEWNGEWSSLAVAFDFGIERQAWLPDKPRYRWASGAMWGRVNVSERWRVGLRPEFYWDPDGLMTSARQTLWAFATTLEYHASFLAWHDLSARMEYRYDRSTGDGGGFYAGDDNHLATNQNLLMVSLIWAFEWRGGGH